jgi:alpha-D-ribose 1-methylphosphonate 5-triphosphate synthase subunit PhnH
MKPAPDDFLPLSPATLHIVLSLAGEPMHAWLEMAVHAGLR